MSNFQHLPYSAIQSLELQIVCIFALANQSMWRENTLDLLLDNWALILILQIRNI